MLFSISIRISNCRFTRSGSCAPYNMLEHTPGLFMESKNFYFHYVFFACFLYNVVVVVRIFKSLCIGIGKWSLDSKVKIQFHAQRISPSPIVKWMNDRHWNATTIRRYANIIYNSIYCRFRLEPHQLQVVAFDTRRKFLHYIRVAQFTSSIFIYI